MPPKRPKQATNKKESKHVTLAKADTEQLENSEEGL